jgi:hypothetical protein
VPLFNCRFPQLNKLAPGGTATHFSQLARRGSLPGAGTCMTFNHVV